jgi:hypothetical protein
MQHVVLISDRPSLRGSLERYFRLVLKRTVAQVEVNRRANKRLSNEEVLATFRELSDGIDCVFEGNASRSRGALVILDFLDPEIGSLQELDPLSETGWRAVAAMLVLAYPEMHIVFFTPHAGPPGDQVFRVTHLLKEPEDIDAVQRLGQEGIIPLFDATNLRGSVIQALKANGVPARKKLMAALDDEESYAYFNAYVAYRFGFRAHVVRSRAILERLFKSDEREERLYLTFEDLYLSFPDRPAGEHRGLSDLQNVRDAKYPGLIPTQHRVLITVGTRSRDGGQLVLDNKRYLWSLRARGVRSHWLYKPLAGVYDIWARSGLLRRLPAGRGPGFIWPPSRRHVATSGMLHSAPGRLLEVAERLLRRSYAIRDGASSVPEAVHGALLALSAKELLGSRTPTTSIEALSLQHELEVTAECMFYGVEYNIDVRQRFQDIRREIAAIGREFHPATRGRSERNARVNLLNRLVAVFKKYGQFEEELACLSETRLLQWPMGGNLPQFYLARLVGSFRLQFLFATIWIVFFACIYWLFALIRKDGDLANCLTKSLETFFLVDAGGYTDSGRLVRTVEYLLGFTHLGIFASRLFLLLVRR